MKSDDTPVQHAATACAALVSTCVDRERRSAALPAAFGQALHERLVAPA